MIPIGIPYALRGIDCVSSDDIVCAESKTETDHICAMYMWFVDLYIGKFDRRCYLPSDNVSLGT